MRIDLNHISRKFRARTVLDNLNLTVGAGERFVVMGRSGTGKTTLLRLIAGLDKPDAGKITLGERIVCGNGRFMEPHERNVGLIFQEAALWPHLTVWQNCELVVSRNLRKKTAREDKVREALEQFRIERFAREYPHTLSAGERQRAALARAVVADPRILLLDEPLNFLDVHLKQELAGVIKELNQRLGVTVVYVTHLPEEALLMECTAGILENGTIEMTGDAATAVDYFVKSSKPQKVYDEEDGFD